MVCVLYHNETIATIADSIGVRTILSTPTVRVRRLRDDAVQLLSNLTLSK